MTNLLTGLRTTPKLVKNASIVFSAGSIADIFTVSGGPILVENIWIQITTAVAATASLVNFESDPTVGAANTDISESTSAPDLASAALGDVFALNGDSQDVMLKFAVGTGLACKENQNGGIFVPIGGIDMILTGSPATGGADVFIMYTPLSAASLVV